MLKFVMNLKRRSEKHQPNRVQSAEDEKDEMRGEAHPRGGTRGRGAVDRNLPYCPGEQRFVLLLFVRSRVSVLTTQPSFEITRLPAG